MRYLDVADGVNLLVFESLILFHSQSGGEWGSTTPTPPPAPEYPYLGGGEAIF